jgi:hypothetical protein
MIRMEIGGVNGQRMMDVLFELSSIPRNEDCVFRYSHSIFELPSTKRNEDCVWHLQVFSFDIRITFNKEKRRLRMASSGILIRYSNYPQQRETKTAYGIFRYSHSIFELPSTKRNEDCVWHLQVFSFDIRIVFG